MKRPREEVGVGAPASLPTRERELKLGGGNAAVLAGGSLPTRERELKLALALRLKHRHASLPTRERELKPLTETWTPVARHVAPYTGA